jgi:nucleoside-diphosphate-sugar epimerase
MTGLVQNGSVPNEVALEDMLSQPTEAVVEACQRLKGDVIVLGVGGKMGPSLARMVRRASDLAGVRRRVLGVSRFGSGDLESRLEADGIVTYRCDLLDESAVDQLPDAANVIYLAGMKFGARGQEARTWAMNAYVPALVCRRYRHSKFVSFSSGNVYGLAPVAGGGSKETDAPAPVGEYAMSCLGRERIFDHFSRAWNIPVVLIRLNYACELRYGVLVDIAVKIAAGQPVDTTMGYFNTIWQGDAHGMAVQSFALAASPPLTLNLTGPELLSIREVGTELAKRMDKPVTFIGSESSTAILSDASTAIKRFGPPRVSADLLMDWIADWVKRGGQSLNKPTHFEIRDGVF